MQLIHVESVRYLKSYELRVEFSDGVTKDVNLEGELWGEVFEPLKDVEPLKDIELFRQARVGPESRTVEWPNGADLAPEFLYEAGRIVQGVR